MSDSMRCPRCGASSHVVETVPDAHYTLRRRRLCDNGHKFLTFELHGNAITQNHGRLKRYAKTLTRRIEKWQRDQQILLAHAAYGWQYVASRWGMCRSNVYYTVRRAKEAGIKVPPVRRNKLADEPETPGL